MSSKAGGIMNWEFFSTEGPDWAENPREFEYKHGGEVVLRLGQLKNYIHIIYIRRELTHEEPSTERWQ